MAIIGIWDDCICWKSRWCKNCVDYIVEIVQILEAGVSYDVRMVQESVGSVGVDFEKMFVETVGIMFSF